ncbi:MAG: GGDEF domain-containing protein [Smithella sp.]|nr:GGDEF domain-containing protein [Smithella sp.]MDM7988742.1 GGDEF domain-containing protein [Smithella sp.]HQG66847.1 GGDEF domain-containing protein [Smithella sp.]HQI73384.1 GGDEF domain-containing protein [Smithella sp.]
MAEFSDRDTEASFQSHVQPIVTRQLRTALVVWGILLLLFAIPDYLGMGLTGPFYYLLAYRVVMAITLFILYLTITPETNIFKISYPVMWFVIVYISGFMLFFIYRPDVVYLVIGVLMIQLLALLVFIPIRFIMSFSAAVYGVFIILLTRFLLGTTAEKMISLFVILLLPVGVGAATTHRLGIMHRREYALWIKTQKINRQLEEEINRRIKLEAALQEMAATDPLTGLYNRRECDILFRHEMERANRLNTPLSVGLIDLDHFKQVNDTYGHAAGDEVLRRTARLFRENLRTMDIVGRWGGEEFIIMLPEMAIDQANITGNRLLQALAATDIDAGSALIKITATIGITQLLPGDKMDEIISRADAALYKGKEAGRNRVEIMIN